MLEIKNVVKKYGNKIGSDHITFNVADGEILVLSVLMGQERLHLSKLSLAFINLMKEILF